MVYEDSERSTVEFDFVDSCKDEFLGFQDINDSEYDLCTFIIFYNLCAFTIYIFYTF